MMTSDEAAEAFVADADLTDDDLSEMVTVRFERGAGSGPVRLPDDLLAASRERAARLDVSLEAFVRSAIEPALPID